MSACEKCWSDAYHPDEDQIANYLRLLEMRKNNPCSPKDQAGQYWDEIKQCDSRKAVGCEE